MTYFLWLSEFLLESSGAFFAFRRKLWPLCFLLGFRAFADVLTFTLRSLVSRNAYGYAWWACYAIQLLLLCWLASSLAGRLLRENKRLLRLGVFASVVGGILVGFIFERGEAWMSRFLDAQISASCWLALVVLVAWFTKAGKLEKPWSLIAAGLLTSIAGNAFCAMLWKVIPEAQYWYPAPAILALIIWNLAGFQPSPAVATFMRRRFPEVFWLWILDAGQSAEGKRKPVTSVFVPRKVQARPH